MFAQGWEHWVVRTSINGRVGRGYERLIMAHEPIAAGYNEA